MDYVFPNKLAELMSKISLRTQLEASMLSLVFIMFGIVFFAILLIFFTNQSLAMKIAIGINSLCGLVLIGSNLVTNYQQYKNHKEMLGLYSNKQNTREVQNGKTK